MVTTKTMLLAIFQAVKETMNASFVKITECACLRVFKTLSKEEGVFQGYRMVCTSCAEKPLPRKEFELTDAPGGEVLHDGCSDDAYRRAAGYIWFKDARVKRCNKIEPLADTFSGAKVASAKGFVIASNIRHSEAKAEQDRLDAFARVRELEAELTSCKQTLEFLKDSLSDSQLQARRQDFGPTS